MTREIYEALSNADVRIERLFWLPGIAATGNAPDDFIEFCEALDADVAKELSFAPHTDDANDVAEALVEHLGWGQIEGFICQLATPVTSNHRANGFTSSWGHYRTTWRYIRSIAEIAPLAEEWAAKCRDDDRAKEAARVSPKTDGGLEHG